MTVTPARKKRETPAQMAAKEKAKLQALLERHDGNLSAMAREMCKGERQITRQALTRQLEKHGLLDAADAKRSTAGISGPRTRLRHGVADPKAERVKLLNALADADNYEGAAAALGMSRRTLFRKVKEFKITPAAVTRAKREREPRAA